MADMEDLEAGAGPDGSMDEPTQNDDSPGTAGNTSLSKMDAKMDIDGYSSEDLPLSPIPGDSGDHSESGNDSSLDGDNSQNIDPNVTNTGTPVPHTDSDSFTKETGGKEPLEKKPRKDNRLFDLGAGDIRVSMDSRTRMTDSSFSTGSRPDSAASSGKGTHSQKEKDPARREKEREREERIRQAREKLAEERQRKIEEMREQQRAAQENRERQLELRRKKIEELKRREEDRRRTVEERRKLQEQTDKAKKEAILHKAKERLTRYEQWKASGRKGMPGSSPPSKQLSVSTSVLYHKRKPEFSSTGTLEQSGMKSGAECQSLMALNTIPENRLGRSFIASAPPTRHKSTVTLSSGVKMRDPKTSPRKPRPASVATSMPSFVRVEMEGSKHSSRSKSTDRAKDRKPPTPRRKEDEKKDTKQLDEKRKSATLPRPYERRKIEERRQEVKKKEEKKEEGRDKTPVRLTKSLIESPERKEEGKARMTRSFIERMSVPRHPKESPEKKEPESEALAVKSKSPLKERASKEKSPVKQKPVKPAEDKEKSQAESSPKRVAKKEVERSVSPEQKSASPARSTPTSRGTPTIQEEATGVKVKAEEDGEAVEETSMVKEGEDKAAHHPQKEDEHSRPEHRTPTKQPRPEPKQGTPEPKAATPKPETKTTPKTDKEREMEEYKAKLAEKRRLAREKAEREAELERQRLEQLRLEEEERRRQEEERQRREEEEALRLAEEARKAEEERLRLAIEAEDQRKREEAIRLEQERLAKEEMDRKAKEEAERLEKERMERSKKEEEERIERKKRLEMIMKRVKTDSSPSSTPEKSRTESPTRILTKASSKSSLASSEDDESDQKQDSDQDVPKFRSPLLQKLTADSKTQNGDSGTPKFKSPLLQSLMGKTKLGARLSGSRSDDSLLRAEKTDSSNVLRKSTDDVSKPEDEAQNINEQVKAESGTIDIVCDSSDTSARYDSDGDRGQDPMVPLPPVVIDSAEGDAQTPRAVSDSQTTDSTVDSAVSLTFNGVSSQNGDVHIDSKDVIDSRELVDSSISMRTVDSFDSSQTGSLGGSLVESQTLTSSLEPVSQSDSSQFEEIIDLGVTNKALDLKAQQLQDSYLNNTEDLLNLNHIDNSNTGDASQHPKPIIAFEDNAARRQDVTDSIEAMATNASMVTTDLSTNQQADAIPASAEAAAASEHAPNVSHIKNTSTTSSYGANRPVIHQVDRAFHDLGPDRQVTEHMDNLWQQLEAAMAEKHKDTKQVLEVYGIGEGEEDSETEEGQIWRMVQGDAPYTLNLV